MPRGRPKKIKEPIQPISVPEEQKEGIKVEPIIEQTVTHSGVNKHNPEHIVVEKPLDSTDPLAPTEGESEEHKRLRLIYIGARKHNPAGWKNDKERLLKILNNS